MSYTRAQARLHAAVSDDIDELTGKTPRRQNDGNRLLMSYTEDDLRITATGELYMYVARDGALPVCSGVVIPGVSPDPHLPYVAQVQTSPSTSATYLYEWDPAKNNYARVSLSTTSVACVPTATWEVSKDGNTWGAIPRADPAAKPVPASSLASWPRDPDGRLQVPVSLSDTAVDWKAKQDELCQWWREIREDMKTVTIELDTEASEKSKS